VRGLGGRPVRVEVTIVFGVLSVPPALLAVARSVG
jgi:hypothetical protein